MEEVKPTLVVAGTHGDVVEDRRIESGVVGWENQSHPVEPISAHLN
jgi:hypothetical protein